jgi:hypothetical protein
LRTFPYFLWSKFITFVGDIKFFGWKRPFWFVFNAPGYRLKGEHYREVIKIIKPGDVLLSRSEQYLDTHLIPGFWTHAGFYFGGTKERVIHAISDGVIIEDIINFMRTDVLVVLRPREHYIERAIALAKSMINMEYDFIFDFSDKNRLSCTELIYCCYPRLIQPRKRMGKMIVVADDIFFDTESFTVIWDSRKHKS